jgi:acyl carrier protein
MKEQIRQVINEHGQLSVDADTLADDADLYQAGMTSHASVDVMIAPEDTFDVEFLDSILRAQRLRERRLDRRGARRGRGPGVSGIVGYRNDTPDSIGRHLRDTMSARLMVANERIHATDASLLLIAKEF